MNNENGLIKLGWEDAINVRWKEMVEMIGEPRKKIFESLADFGVAAYKEDGNGPVIVNIFSDEYLRATNPIEVGTIISVKGKKRYFLVVRDVKVTDGEITYNTDVKYKPSPKSQLSFLSPFTKNKRPLL